MGRITIFCAGMEDRSLLVPPVEAILFSAPNLKKGKSKMGKIKELTQRINAQEVMLDSGGFQLHEAEIKHLNISCDPYRPMVSSAKKGVNLAPEHVLEVAAELDPEWLMGLDFPIRKISGQIEREREFEKKLEFNVKWAVTTSELLPHYGLDSVRLLLPIQCYDLDQFEIFWSMVSELWFGGMSMPVRNMDSVSLIKFLKSMYDKQIRRVHFLGTTRPDAIALSAYAARQYFSYISLDATTWRQGAQYGWYLDPFNLKNISVRPDAIFRGDEARIRCGCSWCSYESSLSQIKDMEYGEKMSFLCQHNFWAIRNFAEEAYDSSADVGHFESFLRERFEQNAADAIIKEFEGFTPGEQTLAMAS